jgi:hypothetical protein
MSAYQLVISVLNSANGCPLAFLVEACASFVLRSKNRTSASTQGLRCAREQLMLGRIVVSLTLVVAIIIAEGSVSSTCVLLNAPNQKVCASPCCATKPCCATSGKRNTESVPPFTTSTSSQQSFVAFTPAASDLQVAPPAATDRSHFPVADVHWHSPETLALLCIRLI